MNCTDAREQFSGLIDDALSADECAALAAHLAECADCQRELARLRSTVTLLSRVEPPRAPAGFADRVLARAQPVSWRRRLAERLFLPLSVKLPAEAAALFLVAGLAIYVFQRTPELQQAAHRESPPPVEGRSATAQAPAPSAARPPESVQLKSARGSAPSPAWPRVTTLSRGIPPTAPSSSAPPRSPDTGARRDESRPEAEATRREATGELASRPTAGPDAQPPVESKSKTEAPSGGGLPAPAEDRAKQTTAPASPSAPGGGSSTAVQTHSGQPKSATAPTLEPAVTPPRPAPAQERADSALRAQQAPLGPRTASNAAPAAEVTGRLTVKDRSSAESALAALLTETRGTLVSRRDEPGGAVIELVVPRAGYARFSDGLERIGHWQREGEPATLPADVRITLRLAQ
jgi:hypothetical protein